MKVEYVNPFLKSTIETFEMMLKTGLSAGTPAAKIKSEATYDISGVIGITGDALGSICLSFPKKTALKVVSRFIGSEVKIVGPDLTDAVGELTNIVAGNAKKDFVNMKVNISLPNVVIGRDHKFSHPRDAQTIVIPFDCALGHFVVEVSLKTK